ncbi:MAG: hypothetical protein RIT81_12875 [Deltaproteobacteria bacterium]
MQQTTQNETPTAKARTMRVRIEGAPGKPASQGGASFKRSTLTSIATLLAAAALAVGATTALAATGRNAEKETMQRVREHQPKLERKDRWERKAVDFDSMWRTRR